MSTMTRDPRPQHTAGREPSTIELVLDIEYALDHLTMVAGRVAELVDVRKPHLPFVSPDARAALDQLVREERDSRRDTTGRSSQTGLKWLRGRETDARLGVGRLAGRPDVISTDADINFTLSDQIRRLAAGLNRSGLDVCVLPRLDTRHGHRPGRDDLARHLRALVHLTATEGDHRLLVVTRRELEALVVQGQRVIHGAQTTTFGDCPHCGRPTIIVTFDTRSGLYDTATATIRCDVDRKTNRHEPCVCGSDWCPCKYKPVTHRHEWNGHTGVDRFKRDRKEAERTKRTQALEQENAAHAASEEQNP